VSDSCRCISMGTRGVLVMMAKAPRIGAVKTRLMSALSAKDATELYRCLLLDTLALAASLSEVDVAIMCPPADIDALKLLAGAHVDTIAQAGEGLASGLASVFAHFTGDQPRPTLAFNSDSPHLPRRTLVAAFEMLRIHDLVVGPTHDGGYYLVGAKSSHPELFAAAAMGTSSALQTLLKGAASLDLSVGFTELFYDVDVAGDLAMLAAELQRNPERAPRTAEWLFSYDVRPSLTSKTSAAP